MSESLASSFDGITVTQEELPSGYTYRVTRYADVILRDAFPEQWADLIEVLKGFYIDVAADIITPGGNRSTIAQRFDGALGSNGWHKQNMSIATRINDQPVSSVRGHEIDMFKLGPGELFPGVAIEMEWNNKDPFFDRDLSNFYALHRAGAIAVGVIVTRGPELQRSLGALENKIVTEEKARGKKYSKKYGASTTHWSKLKARVDIGGGGECPLFLIGIDPGRVPGLVEAAAGYAPPDDEDEDSEI